MLDSMVELVFDTPYPPEIDLEVLNICVPPSILVRIFDIGTCYYMKDPLPVLVHYRGYMAI